MRRRTLLALMVTLPLIALGACFSPNLDPEGGFECEPKDGDEACPAGFRCLLHAEQDHFFCSNAEPGLSIRVLKSTVVLRKNLEFQLIPTNFTFVDFDETDTDVDGQGHCHVNIKGENRPDLRTFSTETQKIEIGDLAPGDYTLVAILMQNNHLPVRPEVRAEAPFKVGAGD